jgi:hypothetical protein
MAATITNNNDVEVIANTKLKEPDSLVSKFIILGSILFYLMLNIPKF